MNTPFWDKLTLASGIIILLILSILCIIWLYHYKTKKLLDKLDQMLEEAIQGKFDPTHYDESQLSKIESKLNRFLSSSNLKKEHLKREQDRIKTLISDISHQTKTPLSNILLYSQLLGEEELPDSARELSAQISGQSEKLSFLIQALIKISRLENGLIKVQPEHHDVNDLLQAAILNSKPKAQNKNIQLDYSAPEQALKACFDPKWLGEALENILDNAIKYSPPDSNIQIAILPYELFIRLDIRDNGIGIAKGELPYIFSRFWRSKNVAEREGVGIGLYLAREIITTGGGYLKVSSQLGEGSVFSIFLPKN